MKKKWYKIINITIAKSTENVYHAKGKTFILPTLPILKTKIKNCGYRVLHDDKTSKFRNDLTTGLGVNYFLWAKTFQGNK